MALQTTVNIPNTYHDVTCVRLETSLLSRTGSSTTLVQLRGIPVSHNVYTKSDKIKPKTSSVPSVPTFVRFSLFYFYPCWSCVRIEVPRGTIRSTEYLGRLCRTGLGLSGNRGETVRVGVYKEDSLLPRWSVCDEF